MIIEKTKTTYYEKLEESSKEWLETKHSYLPFVKYYPEIILSAYREFSSRVEHLHNRTIPKIERIKVLFDNTLQKLSKKDILEKCPDISMSTVELTLADLMKNNYIIKQVQVEILHILEIQITNRLSNLFLLSRSYIFVIRSRSQTSQ